MRIRSTEPAARDHTQICDYIEEHDAPAKARRIALTIFEGISSLMQFPHRVRPGRKLNPRELMFSGLLFIAVYRVRKDVIEINRILHGAQNWP
jgi:plasmid stabilization system protein ParE